MKLTPEITEKLATLIRAGVDRDTAAATQGIGSTTFYRWLQKGRNGEEQYVPFAEAIEKADAECEAMLINYVMKSARDGDWRAAAWRLGKKKPERFGDRMDGDIKLRGRLTLADLAEAARDDGRGSDTGEGA